MRKVRVRRTRARGLRIGRARLDRPGNLRGLHKLRLVLRPRHKHQPRISATDLADLARCERQAIYRHRGYKGSIQPAVQQARARGKALHAQRHQQLIASQGKEEFTGRSQRLNDRRCFIATAVYGPDAWQTNALRTWRDTTLLTHSPGRLLVAIYYRVSPQLAYMIDRCPWLSRCTRVLLDMWVGHVTHTQGSVR